MTDKPITDSPEKQEVHKEPKATWYDPLIKLFQVLLEFNMHTYKTEKVPPL